MYENLSFEEKNEIFNQTMDQFNAAFTKALDILEPKTAIPVAGGFAIRGNHPIETNYLQVRHLDQTNVVNYYRVNSHSKNQSNIFPMQPDMELDVNKHQLISKSYKPWSKEQLDIFFKKIAREEITTNVLTSSKAPGFIKMLKSARNNMWKAQKSYNFFPNYRVYLFEDHYSSLYEIEMKENILIEVQEINNSLPYLKISAGQDTYLEWLMGYEDFNMLDSGHRLKFFREPNIYEVEVYFLLSLFRL
jgi:hypothetical protein